MLTFTEADAILEGALTPRIAASGFAFAGKRTWARRIKPHICELIRFFHTKGAGITVRWGVMLDFVPQVSGRRLKWKRLPQDVYFDLEWWPVDYDDKLRAEYEKAHKRFMERKDTWPPVPVPKRTSRTYEWSVNVLDPLDVFQAQSDELATVTACQAIVFFDRITNLTDVANLLAFQRTYSYLGLGFFNYVQPPLAYAFLLAKLGRVQDALDAYAEYCASIPSMPEVQQKLYSAFAEALTTPIDD